MTPPTRYALVPVSSKPPKLGKDTIAYVNQYGPRCRDCADRDGICDNGMPCGDDRAVRYVIGAINYGWEHGFLAPPTMLAASPNGGMVTHALRLAAWDAAIIAYSKVDNELNSAGITAAVDAIFTVLGLTVADAPGEVVDGNQA